MSKNPTIAFLESINSLLAPERGLTSGIISWNWLKLGQMDLAARQASRTPLRR